MQNELDPSKRAAVHLNSELDSNISALDDTRASDRISTQYSNENVSEKGQDTIDPTQPESAEPAIGTSQIELKEALSEASVLSNTSTRRSAQIVILTKDLSVLTEGSPTYVRITDLRKRFFEIHIVVLNCISHSEVLPITRLFENVWVYPVNASSSWVLSYATYKMITEQLVFSGGFRADVVIAEDVSESGLVGWYVSKKFKRPFELYIFEDFFDRSFVGTKQYPALYEWCSAFVLGKATHVRTMTEYQRHAVIYERPELENTTECIPQYHNLTVWNEYKPDINLHDRYPQFKFILLTITSMHSSSHTSEILHAVAPLLHTYRTIGLIVVGNGPLRSDIEHTAIKLGIVSQVIFEPMPIEVLSHLKTANVFLDLSEENNDDVLILKAAVSKIPIITNSEGIGGSLFTNEESACLCKSSDIDCIRDGVRRYLNENQDRVHFARNAFDAVFERVDQNHEAYLEAYAVSIERGLPPVG